MNFGYISTVLWHQEPRENLLQVVTEKQCWKLKNRSGHPTQRKVYVWLKKPSEVAVNDSPLLVGLHGTCNYK